MRRLSNRRQHIRNHLVEFPWIGLAGHPTYLRKTKCPCSHFFQPLDFGAVSVKQRQKRGLRARRTLDAAKRKRLNPPLQFCQIHCKIIRPQRCPLADRSQLCRLKMGKTQRRQGPIPSGKAPQPINQTSQFARCNLHPLAENNQVCIIRNIAAGRPQMNDAGGLRSGLAEGVNMRHYIVAKLLLKPSRLFVINVLQMLCHLPKLSIGNLQTQILLCPGQLQPQPPPRPKLRIRPE